MGRPRIYVRPSDLGAAPPCKRCNCCPGVPNYQKCKRKWYWLPYCNSCINAANHEFSSHLEYDEYLRAVCWICGDSADGIDHDHNICPRRNHTCEKCRRGAICQGCNTMLRVGRTITEFEAAADEHDRRANRNRMVVKALRARGLDTALCIRYPSSPRERG